MFNGIIYNQGKVVKILKKNKGMNLFLKSNLKISKKNIGISVSCDGVCLTLISFKKKRANALFFIQTLLYQSLYSSQLIVFY